MNVKQLNKKIKEVPSHLVPEIIDYIDFLINKHGSNEKGKNNFSFKWENGLTEISDQFNSVSLQHRSMDWR